jgi:hypothetical protein
VAMIIVFGSLAIVRRHIESSTTTMAAARLGATTGR